MIVLLLWGKDCAGEVQVLVSYLSQGSGVQCREVKSRVLVM